MRSRIRTLRAIVLGGAALVGLVGAHVLDYVVVFRSSAVRTHVLRASGHAYFGRAVEFALVAGILAAVASFAAGLHRAEASSWSTRRLALALALIQCGGFVTLEAGERLAAHALAERFVLVTLLGLTVQLVVAALAAVAISLIEHAGRAVARALRGTAPMRRSVSPACHPVDPARPRATFLLRASPRAPPLAPAS